MNSKTSRRVGRALVLVWVGALLALSLSGCKVVAFRLAPTPVPSPTLMPTWTPSPTMIPTPTFTLTPTATATPTPTATSTPTPTVVPLRAQVEWNPPQLIQGHTGVVRVHTSRDSRILGRWGEQAVGFLSLDGRDHLAFLGVGALAATGTYTLSLALAADDGQQLTTTAPIQVLPGDYDHEEIRFTPEVSKLLDPKIAQPERVRVAEAYTTFSPQMAWEGRFAWPAQGPTTSMFGARRGYGGGVTTYHEGIDIGGITGEPVHAAAAGVVVLAETLQVRGNAVILDHGAGVLSGYYHLDRIAVQAGQVVGQGDLLGAMGATGLVTGSHLHWELRVGGVAVDPREWTERVFP